MSKAQFAGFLQTPSLWDGEQFQIQQFEFPDVLLSSFQPKPIPTNLRLGHQMEYVFQQLVQHSGAYSLVLYNLPIRNEGITLGEIDFILKDTRTGQCIHVELTYKFYLIDPAIVKPIHSLIGPNRRDTFFAKVEKIKNKQFPLLHSPAGIEALAPRSIDPLQLEQQCCFKAQLFQPYKNVLPNLGVFNKACLAGYWLQWADFKGLAFESTYYYLPNKPEWVIAPHHQVAWKTFSEIRKQIQEWLNQQKAPMLWQKDEDGSFKKLFVVG